MNEQRGPLYEVIQSDKFYLLALGPLDMNQHFKLAIIIL